MGLNPPSALPLFAGDSGKSKGGVPQERCQYRGALALISAGMTNPKQIKVELTNSGAKPKSAAISAPLIE